MTRTRDMADNGFKDNGRRSPVYRGYWFASISDLWPHIFPNLLQHTLCIKTSK